MKVRLLKRHTTKLGFSYPMGRILPLSDSYAKKLIKEGIAQEYTGPYPPKKKWKTDFFKPKDKIDNGKN